jgi:hypothetical protein
LNEVVAEQRFYPAFAVAVWPIGCKMRMLGGGVTLIERLRVRFRPGIDPARCAQALIGVRFAESFLREKMVEMSGVGTDAIF